MSRHAQAVVGGHVEHELQKFVQERSEVYIHHLHHLHERITVHMDQIPRHSAIKMIAAVEKAFGDKDLDVIMAGFTDDVVVRFADQPELRGKENLRKLLEARFSRQKGYRLTKRLRMLEGQMIGNYWEGEWEDAITGKHMVGRGTEFWTISDGKVSIWEAAFNVWERDAPPPPPCS